MEDVDNDFELVSNEKKNNLLKSGYVNKNDIVFFANIIFTNLSLQNNLY